MWAASRRVARHAARHQSCYRVPVHSPACVRWLCSSNLRQEEPNTAAGSATLQLKLAVSTEGDMRALASLLAYQALNPGDVYLLHGEVGAGKSTFSRAFIRAAAGDDELPVPSPTFLLQNTYGEDVLGQDVPPLHHFDLYRLTGPASTLERLDLTTCFSQGVCMVEWADRLPAQWLPPSRLDVSILVEVEQAPAEHSGQDADLQQAIITEAPAAHKLGHGLDAELRQATCKGEAEPSLQPTERLYTDERPRTVQLTAFGAYWQDRLQQVQQLLQGAGDTVIVADGLGQG